ncbi:hypothetical protein [Variovorax fucosicus]|uniref:hypothetical protein n=1 Tax=Variovorax fucosicus TaxID=3053517 RepID=UPI002576CAA2|nr:hypothetical protein [Variovorax sp. J22G47]MDM0057354.1 hypothetical protein [Variovorax sp. J22G47]
MEDNVFLPIFDALADSDPGLSPVEPSEPSPVQPVRSLPETRAGGEGREVAATLSRSRSARIELPPGLPNTPLTALQELMLAIVAQGLIDGDLKYITSATFIHHLLYVGLDPDAALNVKIAYLQGRVNVRRLAWRDGLRR